MAESRGEPPSTGQASQGSEHRENWSNHTNIQEDLSLSLNTFDDHIQAGLAELRSLVSKLRGERTNLIQRITNLGTELHQLSVERDHLQHTVSQQQKEISEIKDQFNNKEGENEALRQEIKEMDNLYNNHLKKIAGRHRNRTLAQKAVAKWRRKMHSIPHAKKVQLSLLEAENEQLRAELLACQEAAKQAFLFSANTLNTQALNMFQDAATRRLGLEMNDENEQGQQSSQPSSSSSSSNSPNSSEQSTPRLQDSRRSENNTRNGDKENIPFRESENRINNERKMGRSGTGIRESREDLRRENNHSRPGEHTRREDSKYESEEFRTDENRTRRSFTDNVIRGEENTQGSDQDTLSVRSKNTVGHGRGNYYIDARRGSEQSRGTFTFEMRGPRLDNLDNQQGNINDNRLQSDTNWDYANFNSNMPKTASYSISSLEAESLRTETLAHLRHLREEQQRRPGQNVTSAYEPQRKTPRTITSQKTSSTKCSCSQLTKVAGPYRCPYCNPIHNIRDDLPIKKTQKIGTGPRNTVLSERDKRKVIYKPSASTVVIEKHLNK